MGDIRLRNRLSYDDVVRDYLAGQSMCEVGRRYGFCASSVMNILRRRGITARPAVSERTWSARRGSRDKLSTLLARARTRQARLVGSSKLEDRFAILLDALHVSYTRQLAVYKYNLDFAFSEAPVAVEIRGGSYDFARHSQLAERTKYLVDEGWTIISLHAPGIRVLAQAAEYCVALANRLRWQPPAAGQHRMIWGQHQLCAALREEFPDRACICHPRCRQDGTQWHHGRTRDHAVDVERN